MTKENNLRPDNLLQKIIHCQAKNTKVLLKKKDGFVYINCPACESNNYKLLFEKNSFRFVSCSDCETLYVNPRPSYEMLRSFSNSPLVVKTWNELICKSEDYRRREVFQPRARRVVELCKKYKNQARKIVDVGAGHGLFCDELKKLDFFNEIIAVEPLQERAGFCRKMGVFVIENSIEDIELNGVDVITNFELIEHLSSPKTFLLSCSRALSSGGLFIITTPNIKGFDLITLGSKSDNIGAPNHLNYFHTASLQKLLEKSGFKVLEILTPGKLDAELVRKKINEGVFDISGQPFLKEVLINNWQTLGQSFQDYLVDNKLSSHLWMVARKEKSGV